MDTVPVEKTETRALTRSEQLVQATEMADWLVPYLYGVEIEPGLVADNARDRFNQLAGVQEDASQLRVVKMLVEALPTEQRSNAVLFLSGYPDDAMKALGDAQLEVTILSLHTEAEKLHEMVVSVDIETTSEPETEVRVEPEIGKAVFVKIPEIEIKGRGATEADRRAELEAKGVTRELLRKRLSAYVLSSEHKYRGRRTKMASEFVGWFESNLKVSDFALENAINVNSFKNKVKKLSAIAIDTSFDATGQNDQNIFDVEGNTGLVETKKTSTETNEVAAESGLRGTVFVPLENFRSFEFDGENDEPLAWQSDSLCAQVDPEAFFPEKGGSTREAKKICADCDVRAQCLDYAIETGERFGIWGGLSSRERLALLKKQGRTFAVPEAS